MIEDKINDIIIPKLESIRSDIREIKSDIQILKENVRQADLSDSE